MKKIIITGLFICLMCCMACMVQINARQKTTVRYELKKGTLTIKGKGKMPKSMKFAGNQKIKKVIVKKGVKTISNDAFFNCKKLVSVKLPKGLKTIGRFSFSGTKITKITIPKTVKTVGVAALYNCSKLKTVTMPGDITVPRLYPDEEFPTFLRHVETIKFSTNLSDKFICALCADNLVVSKNDKKYKSIDGVIYTKNGKKTAFLPAREKVVVAEGCTTFSMKSWFYNTYIGDDMYLSPGEVIREITLPKSVTTISNDGITYFDEVAYESYRLKKIIVKNKQIDAKQIKVFTDLVESTYVVSETDDNIIQIGSQNKEV